MAEESITAETAPQETAPLRRVEVVSSGGTRIPRVVSGVSPDTPVPSPCLDTSEMRGFASRRALAHPAGNPFPSPVNLPPPRAPARTPPPFHAPDVTLGHLSGDDTLASPAAFAHGIRRSCAALLTVAFLMSHTGDAPSASASAPPASPAPTRVRKGAEVLATIASAPPDTPRNEAETQSTQPASDAPIQIRIGPYFGWDRCLTIGNGQVEAIIVPDIGRIMQFRFTGQSGAFWEDTSLRGRPTRPDSTEWINFGGDKTWPAPQADWGRVTPRAWPPPRAFDAMPVEVFIRRDTLVMVSPVDPDYGIRTERVISLAHDAPVMTVVTTYEKLEGRPVTVAVWIITQLEEPLGVFSPVPPDSRFHDGYNRQSGDKLPAQLTIDRGLLSLTRDPAIATKIGLDSNRLLWVGSTHMLLIESPRLTGHAYPDQESSAEIYTNPNPKPYVELEMLGPLKRLEPGDRLSQTNRYTLLPRRSPDPSRDARLVLAP